MGFVHETASMNLEFNRIELPDGQELPFHTDRAGG